LKAAESNANVIIYGESGTGKELVAKSIHALSDRGSKPFVPVNCGAIPENLIESEFFGYQKGAFTGANQEKAGFLSAANGGTLFLDEVGEINANMQIKLLRAIDGGGFSPLGSNQIVKPDIRIIAATNRDLADKIHQGHFRSDFFYRIHVIPINLPSLRERREDIPLLIHHFLQLFGDDNKLQSIPETTMQAMQRYDWPGNVREFKMRCASLSPCRRWMSSATCRCIHPQVPYSRKPSCRKSETAIHSVRRFSGLSVATSSIC
jgi:transcriptional regulator with PAS, ATPase and Fis domain